VKFVGRSKPDNLRFAKVIRFIVWRKRAPRHDAAYFRWCQDNARPYIRVTWGNPWAEVLLKSPGYPREFDAAAAEKLRECFSEFGVSADDPKATDFTVKNVPMSADVFHRIAQRLFGIVLRFGIRAGLNPAGVERVIIREQPGKPDATGEQIGDWVLPAVGKMDIDCVVWLKTREVYAAAWSSPEPISRDEIIFLFITKPDEFVKLDGGVPV
jgi:hypothetical protein